MLKGLFTSNTRVKLLTLFLLNPDESYFIRELTRKLDEQINSIRRELSNLKKMGLLRSKTKNRKKFYVINKDFIIFHELRSIIIKSLNSKDNVVKSLSKVGNLKFLLMSGLFVDKETAVDLLIVGEIDREKLEFFLNNKLETKRDIKFTIMSQEDFVYRVKCKDKFIYELLRDEDSIIGINKLDVDV